MSFALRAWFGDLRRLNVGNGPNLEQTFGVYSKLSNMLVGNIVVRDRHGNSDWLATQLHRQVFLCLKQKSVQVERAIPSQFLTDFVGQVELQLCKAISFGLLAQQRISFMWDYALHEHLNSVCFGNDRVQPTLCGVVPKWASARFYKFGGRRSLHRVLVLSLEHTSLYVFKNFTLQKRGLPLTKRLCLYRHSFRET